MGFKTIGELDLNISCNLGMGCGRCGNLFRLGDVGKFVMAEIWTDDSLLKDLQVKNSRKPKNSAKAARNAFKMAKFALK